MFPGVIMVGINNEWDSQVPSFHTTNSIHQVIVVVVRMFALVKSPRRIACDRDFSSFDFFPRKGDFACFELHTAKHDIGDFQRLI